MNGVKILSFSCLKIFEERKTLRIGYLEADGGYFPLPTCQRAVRETTLTLQNMGHTVPIIIVVVW